MGVTLTSMFAVPFFLTVILFYIAIGKKRKADSYKMIGNVTRDIRDLTEEEFNKMGELLSSAILYGTWGSFFLVLSVGSVLGYVLSFINAGLGWVVFFIVLILDAKFFVGKWLEGNQTVSNNEIALLTVMGVPVKAYGPGTVFVPFKDKIIPFTNIIISELTVLSGERITFDVPKDMVMLNIGGFALPFFPDIFVYYAISDLRKLVLFTSRKTMNGIKDYFEGPEGDIQVTDELGNNISINARRGGLLDQTIEEALRTVYDNAANFLGALKPDGQYDEKKVISIAMKFRKEIQKQIEADLSEIDSDKFGIKLLGVRVTSSQPSREIVERMVETYKAEQQITINQNEALATAAKAGWIPKLVGAFANPGDGEGKIELSPEVIKIMTLAATVGPDIANVIKETNMSIILAPLLGQLLSSVTTGNAKRGDMEELMRIIAQNPDEVKKILNSFQFGQGKE